MLVALNKREGLVAITKVWIETGCIACGLSEANCPEVFKVKHGKWVKGATVIAGVDYSGLEKKIKKAAEGCPVKVIKYDEDDDDQKNTSENKERLDSIIKSADSSRPPINRSMGEWD